MWRGNIGCPDFSAEGWLAFWKGWFDTWWYPGWHILQTIGLEDYYVTYQQAEHFWDSMIQPRFIADIWNCMNLGYAWVCYFPGGFRMKHERSTQEMKAPWPYSRNLRQGFLEEPFPVGIGWYRLEYLWIPVNSRDPWQDQVAYWRAFVFGRWKNHWRIRSWPNKFLFEHSNVSSVVQICSI